MLLFLLFLRFQRFSRLAAVLVKYSGLTVTYIILFVRLSIVSKRFNTNFQKGYRLFR